jgi:DNA-binding winged helix-turn-helix (wHTH) protein/tetratricopeptide (TPR) repeat protein
MPHPHTDNDCYQFGPYRLDLGQRVLTRGGETIALTPKAVDILARLVMNAGRVVEKDDLLKEVWADTFVEDANLTQNIFILRRALGDDRADPKYIHTVTGRGYRFVATVRPCSDDEVEAIDLEHGVAANGDVAARLVVAVLPFINASGDDALEYLAEGVTDNIINNLSRVSKLRVMSRSAVFRHKRNEMDPRVLGRELGAKAVLVGTISRRPTGIAIGVELVDVGTGWQLWGESFDSDSKDLLQIQDAITRQLLVNLKLKLTGEEEKRVTARYTENPAAYQAYLEGRYHWSRYTRKGIEKAIGHFRQAIELDPNYALAYSAIVDCYLRLATNYLPPEEATLPSSENRRADPNSVTADLIKTRRIIDSDINVRLRFEWDWKGAERELRRANELNTDYPAAHQWHAAHVVSEQIYYGSVRSSGRSKSPSLRSDSFSSCVPIHIALLQPTASEQVHVFCTIAREQIDIGNYEAASKILEPWWSFGEWPILDDLNQRSSADLLFTAGELAGCVASTKQLPDGQRHGEALLSGSIAIFEQLKSKRRAAEARIELALCYYRQGLFDLGRSILVKVLDSLAADDSELQSLALIRLASLLRHAGRLKQALSYLTQATSKIGSPGPWATGRCHLELASTYKDLAVSENVDSYFDTAKRFYLKALNEFQAVGNHRLTAIAENNLALVLMLVDQFVEAELRLGRARKMFSHLKDRIRCAQVDDSLARLYLRQKRLREAKIAIDRSIKTMEVGDEDALLAESFTTKGMIYCRLKSYHEAQQALDAAYRLAWRCGDIEGAARAILIIAEEMADVLEPGKRRQIRLQLFELLSRSQQTSIKVRAKECLNRIDSVKSRSDRA